MTSYYEMSEKPSALTKNERTRLNELWNKTTKLTKSELHELKKLEGKIR